MRQERLAMVEHISTQLHTVEAAMDLVMTEYARLGLTILEARAGANLSPLLGAEVLTSHAAGHDALSRFMGHMLECHSGLRDLGHVALPGVAIGDTATRPQLQATGGEDNGPRLVASA